MAVERIRDGLIQVDPEAKGATGPAEAYLAELDELDAYIRRKVAELPAQSRVLVTAHDAFGYFGRAYGIEVVGLQGISTDTEVGLRDIQNLVAFLIERRIRAVFVESSVPRARRWRPSSKERPAGATRWPSAASSSPTPWANRAHPRAPMPE